LTDGKKAIFITVRTGSTRLPKKALLDVAGIPALTYLIRRMKLSRQADKVVVCTTILPEDDVLVRLAEQEGVDHFRGSVEDKLARWQGAAKAHGVGFIVTADGDDLLCDPELIDMAFAQAEASGVDFLEAPGLACGAFTYGIRVSALDKVCEIKDTDETEMMWVYFKETGLFKVGALEGVDEIYKRPGVRMTLDYPEDYEFFKTVISHFEKRGGPYGLRDILAWLDQRPEVVAICSHLMTRFLENQAQKTHLKLKDK